MSVGIFSFYCLLDQRSVTKLRISLAPIHTVMKRERSDQKYIHQ